MQRILKVAIFLLLVSVLFPCVVKAQNAFQVSLQSSVPMNAPVRHMELSSDQKLLAVSVATNSAVTVIDLERASIVYRLGSSQPEAPCLAFSPDSRTLATCGRTIRLWDTKTGDMKSEIVNGVEKLVDAVTFAPDGQSLAAWTGNMELSSRNPSSFNFHFSGQIRFWDLGTLAMARSLTSYNHTVWSMAFSPDGATLASSGMSVGWKLWDARTGQMLKEKFEDGVGEILFLGPSSKFAVASKDRIKIYDASSHIELRSMKHGAEVQDLACTRDGALLVSVGMDRKVKFWDVASGALLHTLDVPDQVSEIEMSADGTRLITGGEDVKFWKVARPGA